MNAHYIAKLMGLNFARAGRQGNPKTLLWFGECGASDRAMPTS